MALKLGYNVKWNWKQTIHIMTPTKVPAGFYHSLCRMVNTRAQPHVEIREFDRSKANCKECNRILARELAR